MTDKSNQRSQNNSVEPDQTKTSQKNVKLSEWQKPIEKPKRSNNFSLTELSLKSTPISNITGKVVDLKGDVDSLKTMYRCGNGPNKRQIDQVLHNMKRKIETAERILQIGQHVTHNAACFDVTRVLTARIKVIRKLVNDLKNEKNQMTTYERRCLSQMCHLLLSMADEICHYGDPYRRSTAVKCKVQEEPYWTVIKDCETQVGAESLEGSRQDQIFITKKKILINPCRERRGNQLRGQEQSSSRLIQRISPCANRMKKSPDDPKLLAVEKSLNNQQFSSPEEIKSADTKEMAPKNNQVFCSEVISVPPEIEPSSTTSLDDCWQSMRFSLQPPNDTYCVLRSRGLIGADNR